MVDYYKELGLDRTLGLDELNRELNKLETTWKSRRTKSPEKATKKLALIYDVRAVFSSEEKRNEYDSALKAPKEDTVTDAKKERLENLKKWHDVAWEYYENKEYDLAKTAIDKAISYYDQHDEMAQFNCTVARIYSRDGGETDEGMNSRALEYINQAIILDPSNPHYYNIKAVVLFRRGEYQKAVNLINKALEKSKNEDGTDSEESLIYRSNIAMVSCDYLNDYAEAKKQAVELVRQGDPTGRGQRILDYLTQPHASSYEELKKYRRDEAVVVDSEDLRKEVVSRGFASLFQRNKFQGSWVGWILCEKVTVSTEVKIQYIDSTIEEIETRSNRTDRFVLTVRGAYYRISKVNKKLTSLTAGRSSHSAKILGDWKVDFQLNSSDIRLLQEFDFQAFSNYQKDNSNGFTYLVDSAGFGPYETKKLTRKHKLKGEGLRARLQEIIENHEEPVELMPPSKKPD